MSIFNDKALKSVADAAAKIMEAELSAKQKAIAKVSEPKDKIDSGDLAKLRAGHKPVNEHSDDDTDKYGSQKDQMGVPPKYGIRNKLKKEEVEQIDELSKDTLKSYMKKAKTELSIHARNVGNPGASAKDQEVANKSAAKRTAGATVAGRKLKEETELDEASYSAKAARAGKDIGKPGKAFAKIAAGAAKRYGSEEKGKKVAGAVLKKLRMKEDEEIDMSDEDIEQLLEAFEYDQENQMSFSEMIAAYKEHGLKTLVSEEPDNEQFTKELEDQKMSMSGKKKQPSVAAASTQGVKSMPEEVEVIDFTDVNQTKQYTIELKDLQEKTLTEPETKKKEEVVKSMKKKLPGFKERYGERAKSVLYATATRIAKEKA